MGDRPGKLKFAAACVCAAAGAVLAATVATAQGPGDYQPTTTLPAPPDTHVSFRAKADAGKLRAHIRVKVECDERCSASGRGRLRLTDIPGKGPKSRSFRARRDSEEIARGSRRLKLKIPKKALRIAKSRDFDGRIGAKVTVTAADAAGNTGRDRLRLRFRDPR